MMKAHSDTNQRHQVSSYCSQSSMQLYRMWQSKLNKSKLCNTKHINENNKSKLSVSDFKLSQTRISTTQSLNNYYCNKWIDAKQCHFNDEGTFRHKKKAETFGFKPSQTIIAMQSSVISMRKAHSDKKRLKLSDYNRTKSKHLAIEAWIHYSWKQRAINKTLRFNTESERDSEGKETKGFNFSNSRTPNRHMITSPRDTDTIRHLTEHVTLVGISKLGTGLAWTLKSKNERLNYLGIAESHRNPNLMLKFF